MAAGCVNHSATWAGYNIASLLRETRMLYRITQCYLSPGRGENPAFTPSWSRYYRFSDPRGMQGWVDLCYVKVDQLRIQPATCQSQVQPPSAVPSCNLYLQYNMYS